MTTLHRNIHHYNVSDAGTDAIHVFIKYTSSLLYGVHRAACLHFIARSIVSSFAVGTESVILAWWKLSDIHCIRYKLSCSKSKVSKKIQRDFVKQSSSFMIQLYSAITDAFLILGTAKRWIRPMKWRHRHVSVNKKLAFPNSYSSISFFSNFIRVVLYSKPCKNVLLGHLNNA